ncbi:PD-(D/E)XK nuclease family protein [Mucilaginibacter ginsenosidivorans]|uniref:PD-(D/E)XK nuclease family protein n=1 Tax=Mucilaginibacter ginsenosidivorans TaxID=398053 RepID=A0A5B8UV25_9SPHI|nr:PD-(D/E)XK nuclease family protein [Mucilaginibacter ginsenosidivorans]QEC62977.1 hypothetical protein FRZ54_10430 [Mucilaginibacter ginsenosidivorans]
MTDNFSGKSSEEIMAIKLVNNPILRGIANQQAQYQQVHVDAGFNLFLLISDTYRRENFHSDILKALLDPAEKHGHDNCYLNHFINLLNKTAHGRLIVQPTDYSKAKVYRERGRIDILISDDKSKHAIIIENKINQAQDMPRQLPRYANELMQKGYQIDAIVYLLLNYHHKPNMYDWTEDDKQLIEPKLIIILANDNSSEDLADGWLQVCLNDTSDPDSKSIIKQYLALIKKIGKKAMANNIMEQFYTYMKDREQFHAAQSLNTMLNDLPLYRINRIVETFYERHLPFESIWRWQQKCAVFENFHYQNTAFAIDIYPDNENYYFQVFERRPGECTITELLTIIGELEYYELVGTRLQQVFKFPEDEDVLYNYIENFLLKLRKLKP